MKIVLGPRRTDTRFYDTAGVDITRDVGALRVEICADGREPFSNCVVHLAPKRVEVEPSVVTIEIPGEPEIRGLLGSNPDQRVEYEDER